MMFHTRLNSVIALVLVVSIPAFSQWEESNKGIYGGLITSLSGQSGLMAAGTIGGVYVSIDNANSWDKLTEGLDNTTINSVQVINSGRIAIATAGMGGFFVSVAPFISCIRANVGLPTTEIKSIELALDKIFVLTVDGELYISPNEGASWAQVTNLPGKISSFSSNEGRVFVTSDQGVFASTDGGNTWNSIKVPTTGGEIYGITFFKNFAIASAKLGVVFFSRDGGNNWVLSQLEFGSYELMEFNNILLAGNQSRVYFSSNSGTNWDQIRGLPGVNDFVPSNGRLIAGNRFGVFRSLNGIQWTNVNGSNLTNSKIIGFASLESEIFVGSDVGIYKSNDVGRTWFPSNRGLPLDRTTAISQLDGQLLVALASYGIYTSKDQGSSWLFSAGIANIFCFAQAKHLWIAGGQDGLYTSSDKGQRWVKQLNINYTVKNMLVKNDTIFLVSPSNGVSMSSNLGVSWISLNAGFGFPFSNPNAITTFDNKYFLATDAKNGVFRLNNSIPEWTSFNQGLAAETFTNVIAGDSENLFAGGNQGVHFFSNNRWINFFRESLPKLNSTNKIETLFAHRQHLFAGTGGNGVLVSCVTPKKPKINLGSGSNGNVIISTKFNARHQWFLNGELISDEEKSTMIPKISGEYSVKVNIEGCDSEISNSVFVEVPEKPDAIIEMPNVFTPNGDDYNALFAPNIFQNIESASLKIIDRWGVEIFRSDKVSWDGGDARPGIYFFEVKYRGVNGMIGRRVGWLQLIK